jgi:HlyD family secretion protein
VTTGVQDANVIEIKSGITSGDKVVAGPYTALSRNLKGGDKVIVKDKDTFYDNDDN